MVAGFVAVVFWAAAGLAQRTTRVELEDGRMIEGVKVVPGRIAQEHLVLLGVQLQKTTLREVREKLGPADVGDRPADRHAGVRLCYLIEGGEPTRLTVGAGPWEWVQGPITSYYV